MKKHKDVTITLTHREAEIICIAIAYSLAGHQEDGHDSVLTAKDAMEMEALGDRVLVDCGYGRFVGMFSSAPLN